MFAHLTSNADTEIAQDFLTYAVFAYEKGQWIELWKSRHNGQEPTQDDIDAWISNLTESQFVAMRASARNFFLEAAEALFESRLESERESILREAIIAEVRSASDWRKQLGIALLTTIAAPLILGGLIVLGLLVSRAPTPADIAGFVQSLTRSPAPASPPPAAPPIAPTPTSKP